MYVVKDYKARIINRSERRKNLAFFESDGIVSNIKW